MKEGDADTFHGMDTVLTAAPVRGRDIEISPGTMVGRYVLFERIGAGAGGAVFRAFDPELSRYLGIKVLQSPGGTVEQVHNWRSKVMREAQALAQLSHPHVVAIHDVGVTSGRVYIAMELVDGKTLREWVADAKPTWREIVDVYLQAGEGLSAAHEAGLVHRDFKPSNAALGLDGRVRVLDFGLAKGVAEVPDEEVMSSTGGGSGERRSSHPEGSLLDVTLTVQGIIAGTPVYMAPEQLRGHHVDARSDQFAFCVALFEAVANDRPFPASTPGEHRRAKSMGRFSKDALAKVPRRLRRILLKGLAPDPDQRYRDMSALMAALREVQVRRWPKLVAAGTVTLALGAGVAAGALRPSTPDPCAAADGANVIWSASDREAVSAAFGKTGASGVSELVDKLDALMTRASGELRHTRVDVCEATHVRKTQSEALMDARGLCLDRAEQRLDALVKAYVARPTPALVARAYEMALEAADIAECSDADRLASAMAATEASTAPAELLAAMDAQIDQANIARKTGSREEAAETLERVYREALDVEYWRGAARAQSLMASSANLRGEGELAMEHLDRGLELATQARDPRMCARLYTQRLDVVINTLAERERGEAVGEAADHFVRLAGDPPDLRGELEIVLGSYELQSGNLEAALSHLKFDERMMVAKYGENHYRTAKSYSNVGGLLLELGDVQGARARLERALKILERDVGDNYLTSAALINLGLLHLRTGEWRAAETYLERALRIEEQIGGTKSAGLRWPLNGLGMVKLRLGDLDEADRLLTRARRIQEETLGPRHPAVANNIANLASVAEARGELDEAERLLREARSLLSEDVGSRLDLAAIDNLLVSYELERGSCEGLETLETGRALIVEARGESHEEVALLDRTISRCHLVRGEFDEAVTAARRAYDAMKRIPDVGDRAGVAFTLAKALEARNGEHDRADSRKVALSALESFESRSEFYGEEIDEVQAWLAR